MHRIQSGKTGRHFSEQVEKTGLAPQRHWTRIIADLFTKKHCLRTAAAAFVLSGSLFVGSSFVIGADGAQGDPGNAGAVQSVIITSQDDIDDTTKWGNAGTAGGVGGIGGNGTPGFASYMGGRATAGGPADKGGQGGTSGASGRLNVTFDNPGEVDFSNITSFGAKGVTGIEGGNGGRGGSGGYGEIGTQPPYPNMDGAAGGLGGIGGTGAVGGVGSLVNFETLLNANVDMSFARGTIFGGEGGTGGVGGNGGNGGAGGYGGDGLLGVPSIGQPDVLPGSGGDGANGGVGGVGGNGGKGGNAEFNINGGTITFSSAQFGGDGGKGGDGGVGGAGGAGGAVGEQGDYPSSDFEVTPGVAGAAGNGGKGGNGGAGGSGTIIINNGFVVFAGDTVFGGKGGQAGSGGAAGGTGASAGAAGAAGAVGGNSTLTIKGGEVTLGDSITFQGTGNKMTVGTGSVSTALDLNYNGDTLIDLGANSTFKIDGGLALNREADSGILTIKATNIEGNNAKIMLNVLAGNGVTTDFLTVDGAVSGLTASSFDTSGYRGTATIGQTGANTYNVTVTGGIATMTWTGSRATDAQSPADWIIGADTEMVKNWTGADGDFYNGDTAVFTDTAATKIVNLVGATSPGDMKVNSGNYTFQGAGALVTGNVSVANGASLTFTNTGENKYSGGTTIAGGGTVNANLASSLGNGAVSNSGTVNFNGDTNGTVANKFSGNGRINVSGGADFVFTADNDASGTLNVTDGSVTFGNGGATGSYAGNIASVNDVIVNRSTDWNYSGVLSGTAGLVKQGAGTMTLSGSNTYQGGTEIDGGKIVVANDAALGAGATNINNGGTLDVNGYTPMGVQLNNGGKLLNDKATSTVTFTDIKVQDASVTSIGGAGNMTFNADLAAVGESVSFEKIGAGTVTLTTENAGLAAMVSAGTLVLTDDAGNSETATFEALANGRILINRSGTIASLINGVGSIDIAAGQSVNFVDENGDARTFTITKSTTIAEGSQMLDTPIVVASGAMLEVTGVLKENIADVAIKGGSLTLEDGSTFRTNLVEYELTAGGEVAVYVADELTAYTTEGNPTLDVVDNQRLYKWSDITFNEDTGSLYYMIKRRFGAEMFPNVSPSIGPVIDDYDTGNMFFEDLLDLDTDAKAEKAIQSGFDIGRLSNTMSAVYEAKLSVNKAMESRALDGHRNPRSSSCDPCDAVGCGRGKGQREAWVSLLYENARGFGLTSGKNFRYGYTNDMYGGAFGVDRTKGNTRLGVMGVGGWGKIATYGSVAKTRNETSFGGVYGYASHKMRQVDLFISAGWLGMNSDIDQVNIGKGLSGDMDSGLASVAFTLSKTLCFDGLHLTPSIGLEYGYYYQEAMGVGYGNDTVFWNEKSDADIFVLPVGLTLSRDMKVRGGTLSPILRARYIANVGDVVAGYRTWAAGSAVPATMAASMADRHAGEFGLGIGWNRRNVTLSGDYGYMFSDHHQSQFVSLSGVWKF